MKKTIILSLISLITFSVSAKEKLKVACVGNSVTYGYTLPDRDKNAYPSQLQNLLGDDYEVRNFGHSGATLLKKGHRPYNSLPEYKLALDYAADYVIIHLGLNDTDPRNWANYRTEFTQDYLDLINSFREENPKVKISICRMSPITHDHRRFKSGTRDWYRQIQKEIEHIAKIAEVNLIDLEQNLYSRPDLLPDALHPNIEGAEIISQQIYSAITGDYGGLKMPEIYSGNMVLQRNQTLKIHGIANANELITVEIAGQKISTYTRNNGKWDITLNPLNAATDLDLKISGKSQTLHYKNVAVGEVWLCSGQSNMAFMLKQSANADVAQTDNSNIRFFDMKPRWETNATEWGKSALDSINKLNYFHDTQWELSNDKTASNFSAIAFHFGKMLADSLQIPIGLIHNSVGGSTTESWIDRSSIELHIPDILHNWHDNDFVMDWARGRAALNTKKSEVRHHRHPYQATYLFEAGIKPLERFPIAGVIWYQGESNAHNVELHEQLFPMLIDSWRNNWNNPYLPFHFVQLSSINRPPWAHFRDSQRQLAEKKPHTYMTVSSDLGDYNDVHPVHKLEVGQRLAASALHHSYNKKHITPSGPLFKNMKRDGSSLILSFDYGTGLKAKRDKIIGFEIAESDKLYKKATAEIIENGLRVYADSVNNPIYVRYAYTPYTEANLINSDKLPVSTFSASLTSENMRNLKVQALENYPVKGGISAPFIGVHNNQLIVAGGCNFTDKNGQTTRTFYNDVYRLELSTNPENNKWNKCKKLPLKIAYGASVTIPEGIVFIGGNTDNGISNKVSIISFDNKKNDIAIESLPNLPLPLSNIGACISGRTIYVGGAKNKIILSLNLDDLGKGWEQININSNSEYHQPIIFSQNNQLFMAGGYDENKAKVSSEVLRFDFDNQEWESYSQIATDGNEQQTMIGAGGLSLGSYRTLFVGGVNHNRFLRAIDRLARIKEAKAEKNIKLVDKLELLHSEYMNQDVDWYKFRSQLLMFNSASKRWENIGYSSKLARAGAGVVLHNNKLFIIGGELKPGVRTESANYIDLKDFN